MKTVNMHEAKTHLSRLVEAAARGEPFVIARAGKPLVKVVALEDPAPRKSPFGFLQGRFAYSEEVDRHLDEEVRRMFEDSINRPLDFGCDPEGAAEGVREAGPDGPEDEGRTGGGRAA
jgi:prevent-host-death family protein